MFICFPFLLVSLLLLYTTTTGATPYFRPWLEIRQTPTNGFPANLIYPPNNDATTCPKNPTNLWKDGSLIAGAQKRRKRRRNIHDNFQVPVANPRGQHAKRALVNGTCQTIATLGFEDWEQSYGVNTPTITLEGGHKYTFSIAANVDITKIECWTKKPNSGDFQSLGKADPKTVKNATLVTEIKSTVSVHWHVDFRFGHPRGNLAVFSDKKPTLTPDGQWAPGSGTTSGTVATSKLKLKPKKKRRKRRRESSWLGWFG